MHIGLRPLLGKYEHFPGAQLCVLISLEMVIA